MAVETETVIFSHFPKECIMLGPDTEAFCRKPGNLLSISVLISS